VSEPLEQAVRVRPAAASATIPVRNFIESPSGGVVFSSYAAGVVVGRH
jgi:hypothetical protein